MIPPMKNKYIYRSRISEKKFREILDYVFRFALLTHFARSLDIEATKISVLSGVSRITLNKLFKQIRILIAKECENISKLQGEIEIDESYFLFHNCKQKELKE